MRTKLSILFLIATMTACVHMTPQKVAVNSLFTAGKTVNTAYAAYVDSVLAGSIKTNSFPRVSTLYGEFQSAFGIAVAGLPGTNSIGPVVVKSAVVLREITAAEKGK